MGLELKAFSLSSLCLIEPEVVFFKAELEDAALIGHFVEMTVFLAGLVGNFTDPMGVTQLMASIHTDSKINKDSKLLLSSKYSLRPITFIIT